MHTTENKVTEKVGLCLLHAHPCRQKIKELRSLQAQTFIFKWCVTPCRFDYFLDASSAPSGYDRKGFWAPNFFCNFIVSNLTKGSITRWDIFSKDVGKK